MSGSPWWGARPEHRPGLRWAQDHSLSQPLSVHSLPGWGTEWEQAGAAALGHGAPIKRALRSVASGPSLLPMPEPGSESKPLHDVSHLLSLPGGRGSPSPALQLDCAPFSPASLAGQAHPFVHHFFRDQVGAGPSLQASPGATEMRQQAFNLEPVPPQPPAQLAASQSWGPRTRWRPNFRA